MQPEDFLKNGKVYIWKDVFDIIKSKKKYDVAFANIVDNKEITVIINHDKYNKKDAIEIESGWKMLTFDMILPFELTGFLASVAATLAQDNIPIFAVSGYSTDHILVKEKYLTRTIEKLKSLGCLVERK